MEEVINNNNLINRNKDNNCQIQKNKQKITITRKEYYLIFKIAFISRLGIILLGKISSIINQPFDKSIVLYEKQSFFRFLNSWDAVHFLNIAENGYGSKHSFPFFPLLPLLARTVSYVLKSNMFRSMLQGASNMYPQLSNIYTFILLVSFYANVFNSGILINNAAFISSSLIFYKLSRMHFTCRKSLISTILFISNPSSIVYCAFYSESIFALLFLIGLYHTHLRNMSLATIFFSMSCLARSNGIVFIIFLDTIHIIIPFTIQVLFQLYCLNLINRAKCSIRLVFPYSQIQRIYWNQGFLKFLKLQNLPNIIIGLPIILYCILVIYLFLKEKAFYFKGFRKLINFYKTGWNIIKNPTICGIIDNNLKCCFILIFQTLVLIFFAHWNTAMRFISYNPILYYFGADCIEKYKKSIVRKALMFFMIYGILYIVMFSCFYPPA